MTDLSNLKVGDVVFRRASHYDDLWNKVTITGETKTLWKTDTGERFYKKNGFRVGNRRAKKHQSVWNKFSQLGRPKHITVERLQAIYDELKGEK